MEQFYDDQLITASEFEEILNICFEEDMRNSDEKGAGAFCRFINYNGQNYAVLSKRAQNLVCTVMKNIAHIINKRDIPVSIVGGAFNVEEKGDYALILPKIEGINLPSYVYPVSKNVSLISAMQGLPQEAMDKLAEECDYLNSKSILIDFHGGNFLYEKENEKIRMLDLKNRKRYSEDSLITRFIRLSSYNQIPCFKKKDDLIEKIKYEQGVDINYITAQNVIKSYIALSKIGYPEEKIASSLSKIYGEGTKIEDFENIRK